MGPHGFGSVFVPGKAMWGDGEQPLLPITETCPSDSHCHTLIAQPPPKGISVCHLHSGGENNHCALAAISRAQKSLQISAKGPRWPSSTS